MFNEKEAQRKVKRLEKELLTMLLLRVPEFSTDKVSDRIKLNERNMRLTDLNSLFKEFNEDFQAAFLISVLKDIKGFKSDLDAYYKSLGFKKFPEAHKNVDVFNKSVENYVNQFALTEAVKLDLQGFLATGISSNITQAALARGVRNELRNKLQNYYNQFLWEEVVQIERIQNNFYAAELELNWFIYEGGLIETSRQFCIKRNGRLFNRADAKTWRFDPTLPQPETSDTYKPLVELGRWNCRHSLRWITDEQAEKLNK